ncbi:hypothetical protein QBC39DRAFT_317389 [Podospora conica]|nr:hypothetical protein QBC39DRAFT_317389 [Schizothecium conicum]
MGRRYWGSQASQDRRKALSTIARETKTLTPIVSASLAHLDITLAQSFSLNTLPPLSPTKCPGFAPADTPDKQGTVIRVIDSDSFDAAISMPSTVLRLTAPEGNPTSVERTVAVLEALKSHARHPENLNPSTAARVAVLNMASEKNPGGGWLGGSTAQEEALCYRSTLAASLDKAKFYPIPVRAGLYTRDVVVLREEMGKGHGLLDGVKEGDGEDIGLRRARLPVVSVVSVAGLRHPAVKGAGEEVGVDETPEMTSKRKWDGKEKGKGKGKKTKVKKTKGPLLFANASDRESTKNKMRLCLRIAASQGHTMVVLGALGCGAFKNPPGEVVTCWSEVLSEPEFGGGWFAEIWFAVLDRRREGNFEVFEKALDGKVM